MKFVLGILLIASLSFAQPTIYIVRHAEKTSGWPGGKLGQYQPLNDVGIKTSHRLKAYFKNITLNGIYTSETTRTMQTAFPTSQDKKIKITVHEAVSDTSKISAFIKELNSTYNNDDAVLIVSHSNLIPYYLFKFGVKEKDFSTYRITQTPSKSWYLTDYYGVVFKIKDDTIDMIEF